ncbi:MAG: Alkaline phosphatase PafA [Cryomorphaceae bacterium]|nr:MAG: Alkaline phosphatase PafA [Cryomorphaceae bacterium]
MKKILLISLVLITGFQSFSQKRKKGISFSLEVSTKNDLQKPKLVVGIVVDQMRYDYIYRFWDDFGDDGFKRLISEGHFFRNAQFGYVPTYTGPGHASIYTGTTPSVHGIIANDWYDKNTEEYIYCAGDGDMHTVCDCDQKNTDVVSADGKMSPHHMLTTTFSDELKLFNNESKVYGISLKDRGAILPAGHSANGAFWLSSDGKWITSSFYMNQLPDYIKTINDNNPSETYLKGEWAVKGKFSHNLDTLLLTGAKSIKKTPFGNSILKDLAIDIINEEELGQGENTDIITISFSSTDYIGHQYGPHAAEIKDTYIRLDKDITEILSNLDKEIGTENVVLFITADHGVVSEPQELLERNIPAGYFDGSVMKTELSIYLNTNYGEGEWIKNYSNNQLFLNQKLIAERNINLQEIERKCANFFLKYEWVKNTYTATQINENEYNNSFHSLIQRGYNQKRSGDVIVSLQTGWLSSYWEKGGTTHGSSYSYDTHVPLIFWGGTIPQGQTDRKVNIRDIAPTISTILGTAYPNGCTGNPLPEVTE